MKSINHSQLKANKYNRIIENRIDSKREKEKRRMESYFNNGNIAFATSLNTYYVDKTGLIEILNKSINTDDNLFCISRPRRFGKSMAANMIGAYYDCTCDSHPFFNNLEISSYDDYETHINKYNVIHLDIADFISDLGFDYVEPIKIIPMLKETIRDNILSKYPNIGSYNTLNEYLSALVHFTNKKIVFIIDEWDVLIREIDDVNVHELYFNFLRSLFKNNYFKSNVIAFGYMTGILPIKTDGSQSAISIFQNYTFLNPGPFVKYTGFTDDEVKKVCVDYNMDYKKMKKWYDGYNLIGVGSIYSPFSVMRSSKNHNYQSYWVNTSSIYFIKPYIEYDLRGLKNDLLDLISGNCVKINTSTFQNDLKTIKGKDDILTLLAHLGYLSYDSKNETVKIPNNELKLQFYNVFSVTKKHRLSELIQSSRDLYKSTIMGYSDDVEELINKNYKNHFSNRYYNNEQSLKSVIRMLYISCINTHEFLEEYPAGIGYADIILKPFENNDEPALIIELKYEDNSKSALDQIKNKEYIKGLNNYNGEVVLVGINYDKNKKHTCSIERGEYYNGVYKELTNKFDIL